MIRTTRRRTAALAVVGLALLLGGCGDDAPAELPGAPARGNLVDAADVLTDAEEQGLNAQIDALNARTDAARVAVLTVDGADGTIEDFADDVATAWGVGDPGADNGVLIVADTGERELRIEVADGVRESFGDDDAEDVIDDVLEPAFGDDDYAGGLTDAVDQVYLYAEGGGPVEEPFDWGLLALVLGGIAALVGGGIAWVSADHKKRRRATDAELKAAEDADPDFELSDEQREAYRKYRYSHHGKDDISSPAIWLPLYISHPAMYSGQGSTGSSVNGGGGFSGGGASGSY